jgi:hypothetical protein
MKPDAQIRFFSLSLSGQPIMPAIQTSHATMEIRLGTIQVLTQTLLSTAARQALSWQPARFDLEKHHRGCLEVGMQRSSGEPG